jgi:hypothetical protein
MAESQSRYSIVADLTKTKLDIITAKSNLENESKLAQQKVTQLKEDLKDWEASQKGEAERQKREKERQIKQAEREASNSTERKKAKENSFDLKLKAIEDALGKIQAISDSAAKESSK